MCRISSFLRRGTPGRWKQAHQDIEDRKLLDTSGSGVYGDDIAAVIAEDDIAAASAAADKVKVEYEEYEPVILDPCRNP